MCGWQYYEETAMPNVKGYKSLAETVEHAYANTKPEGGCLISMMRRPDGYGQVSYRGRSRLAHRLVALHVLGPAPEGMEVMHMCQRGHEGCVTRSHLRYGTRSENVRHAAMSRRNPGQKLSTDQVRRIRWLRVEGMSVRRISAIYGISVSHTKNIIAMRAWAWLD